jgi:hypothetical protein
LRTLPGLRGRHPHPGSALGHRERQTEQPDGCLGGDRQRIGGQVSLQGPEGGAPAEQAAGTRPDLVDRGRRLFRFLAAAQRLRMSPVRTTDTYERDGAVFWLGELPDHEAVTSALGSDTPAPDLPVLAVGRVPAVEAPAPGAVIVPWLEAAHTDPERAPGLRESRPQVDPTGATAGEKLWLEDHPEVTEAYERWRCAWDPWAEKELADRPVRALYKNLFSTYNTAMSQAEELELVLGVGCLAWVPGVVSLACPSPGCRPARPRPRAAPSRPGGHR